MNFNAQGNKIAAFIGRQKLYMDRGRGWWSLPSYLMQGVTLLAVVGYRDWIVHHPIISTIVGMAGIVLGLIITGQIEKRLGVVQAEYGQVANLSPVYQQVFTKFEDLNRQNEILLSAILENTQALARLAEVLIDIRTALAEHPTIEGAPDYGVDSVFPNTSHNYFTDADHGRLPADSIGGRLNPNIQ